MGFMISIVLPFHRCDVWRELTQRWDNQLGMNKSVTVAMVQPGETSSKGLSLGLVRKVTIPGAGATTSRLVALETDQRVAWEVLQQMDTVYTLRGRSNPVTSILLADVHACDLALAPARPIGTEITLGWECDSVSGPGCFAEADMRRDMADLGESWHADMIKRGYDPLPPR